ncbi:restriction endonuclease [Dactylosporangium sp. CS-047395]|uniref:restriction endonuclease n=1 Tax=Dactylosporangium sp. CS-047395 TaxID=3239936 RepID=UPI003D8A815E
MVRDLERLLAGAPVEVKSPDYITGKLTRRRREIDVSVRAKVGTVPMLGIIECRKRKDRQDSRWIEQLVTKMEDVGASRVVAVSAKPFTSGAVSLAAAKNIELRTFSEVTTSFLLSWILPLFNKNRDFSAEWTDLHVALRRPPEAPTTAPPEIPSESWQVEQRVDAPLFALPDGSKWTLNDIFFKDILFKAALAFPKGQSEWRTSAARDFSGPVFYTMQTPHGACEVVRVSADIFLKMSQSPIEIEKAYEYAGEYGVLSHSATATSNHGGIPVEYGIHAPSDGQRAYVTVRRTDNNDDRILAIGFPAPDQSPLQVHPRRTPPQRATDHQTGDSGRCCEFAH